MTRLCCLTISERISQRLVEVFTRFRIRFELRGYVVERLGDNRIQRGVGTRNRLAGGNRTEFKLVASEGEGVTVAADARELGEDAGAEFHSAALLEELGEPFSSCSMMSLSWSPRKMEMMAGELRWAPRR